MTLSSFPWSHTVRTGRAPIRIPVPRPSCFQELLIDGWHVAETSAIRSPPAMLSCMIDVERMSQRDSVQLLLGGLLYL
jgi:hypothetical protein